MMRKSLSLSLAMAAAVGLAGCRVNVDKDKNGEDKSVQVDTPFGGLHVNTNQTTAADLGLPLYPGAQAFVDDDRHKSADVHMGFGEWQLRVRAVSYSTPDSQDKVVAFYKKALARYGDVIFCHDKEPVGTPTATSEGLTCADNNNGNVHVVTTEQGKDGDKKDGISITDSQTIHKDDFELKAGSKRHQHIVSFEQKPENGKTVFELVALDLPEGLSGKSD
jgi:hypothetical protein